MIALPTLHPQQSQLQADIFNAWREPRFALDPHGIQYQCMQAVLAVLPTGGGKTVLAADTIRATGWVWAVIAHRAELVSQLSLALARCGVRHRVIGSSALVRTCSAIHIKELGRNFVDPGGKVAACSVDTVVKRDISHDSWFRNVQGWMQDEAHHVLRENKWGRCIEQFPVTAAGLGLTAGPERTDGKGIARWADGVFDKMVMGPDMRWHIRNGYLTDYRVFCVPTDVNYAGIKITASGELSQQQLSDAVHKSNTIVGDVVQQYMDVCPGERGITFAVDLWAAEELAAAYRQQGVPAEFVSGKTPDALRFDIINRFRRGDVKQLVNVDLFGEGFDVPAVTCVSMARRTMSFQLYRQMCGRMMRLFDGKEYGYLFDHVGNWQIHSAPDAPRFVTMDRREGASSAPLDVEPTRTCLTPSCNYYEYSRFLKVCPICKEGPPAPAARSSPMHVDGKLNELDPEAFAKARGDIIRVDGPAYLPVGATGATAGAIRRNHSERQDAQQTLRHIMNVYGGLQRQRGAELDEAQSRFYFQFGVDVATAQTLGRADAAELEARIIQKLTREGVTWN